MSANSPAFSPLWTQAELDALLQKAFAEDLHGGDVTSRSIIQPGRSASARAVAKQDLVVCGIATAHRAFSTLDPSISFESFVDDGQRCANGEQLFQVRGDIHAILGAERIALNLLQHLSGIATLARKYADAVKGTRVRVVDTRKTLPGLRAFQRHAVQVGGCANHRYHLGSGILIKENHIRVAGSISSAIERARQNAPHTLRVEIEVTSRAELEEALQAGAELIMLDNMIPAEVEEAVRFVDGRALLEASGGIDLNTVRAYAQTGVDIISIGALTHSVTAADISLLVDSSAQGV